MWRGIADRRERLRFEIVGDLCGSLAALEPLTVRNVGRGGVLLEAPWAPSPGSVHQVRVRFNQHTCEVRARVAHVRPAAGGGDRCLIGLEFLDLQADMQERFDKVLAGASAPG